MWVLVYFLLFRTNIPRLFDDNDQVTNISCLVALLETVFVYYFVGFYIFPTFFYRRKYLLFLLSLTGIFFLTYQINYTELAYLASISNGRRATGEITYARKIFALLRQAGRLGCFTDLRVALWHLSYGFFAPILMLVYRGFSDIIGYQRKVVAAERDKFALELDFLRSQINPHSLFNVLNSVYADVFETNEKAADLVLRLSELMRYNLYEADVPRIGLDKELAYIQNYLDLERNRLSGQDVSIEYAQTGNFENYQIAPLLLIAFVENAFKHGVKGAKSAACVEVFTSVENGQFTFQVENSIAPKRQMPVREAVTVPKSGGIGLGNVQRRLDALYKGRYGLMLTPAEDRYTVVLTIQLDRVKKN